MTHRSRSTLNGVVGANEGQVDDLTAAEVLRLRQACCSLDATPHDLEAMIALLSMAAYNLRSLYAQADANTSKARSANLKIVQQEIEELGRSTTAVTSLNRELLQLLRLDGYEDATELDLVKAARRKLRVSNVGRGDRPRYELDYCGFQVAQAYERQTSRRASMSKEGDFVELLGEVIAVALGKPRKDVHRIAERALRGAVEASDGVTIFTPHDLVETGGK